MAKKMIRPIRSETEYDGALDENEPKPGTPEADRFDFLALIVFGWTGVLDLRIV